MRVIRILLASLAVFVLPAPAVSQEPPPAAPVDDGDPARAAIAAGTAAYAAGDFAGAAAQFEAAYRLTGSADIAFNVGLSYDNAGEAARAAEWYRIYVEAYPEAPDRAEVEARIAELQPDAGVPGEEDEFALGNHRLRVSAGYGFYLGGAVSAVTTPTPVDLAGFRLELGYQLALYKGLILDVVAGGTFSVEVQQSRRTWDAWSAGVGLGWVWTDLPYIVVGIRGGVSFYAMVPNVGDIHWLVPFRAGAWIEFPIADWFALHLGGDLLLGAYVARDDKIFGFAGEVGAGATFSFGGGEAGDDEPEPEPEPAAPRSRPSPHGAPDLGAGWQ
jgi:hypothetical protein